MALAYGAQHAISSGHVYENHWVFRRPWPSPPADAYIHVAHSYPRLQVISSQSGKDLRSTTPNFTRLLSSATTETKVPINRLLNPTSQKAIITVLSVLVILHGLFCSCAQAAEAIKASSLGLKVASFLRQTGWPDEAIVFLMAMLPVLELRGAIPVGYWMRMDPFKLSMLSVLGNMVPVPFIILYMEKLAIFLSNRSSSAKKVMDGLFESTRRKAAPVQEFEWLGLMLFVAVPFPGTGAWTGAMVASVLGMPFGQALSANFVGVVMAGLLVNLLVNLGLKYAVIVGVALFVISTFMWSFLRAIGKSKN